MSIRVVGQQALINDLRKLSDGDILKEKVFEALTKGGEIVRDDAKERVPAPPAPEDKVRTGDLQDSLKVRKSKKYGYVKVEADYPRSGKRHKSKREGAHHKIGSRKYYAFAVEHGTRTQEAQPFLNPAVEAKEEEILALVEEAMVRAVEGALE